MVVFKTLPGHQVVFPAAAAMLAHDSLQSARERAANTNLLAAQVTVEQSKREKLGILGWARSGQAVVLGVLPAHWPSAHRSLPPQGCWPAPSSPRLLPSAPHSAQQVVYVVRDHRPCSEPQLPRATVSSPIARLIALCVSGASAAAAAATDPDPLPATPLSALHARSQSHGDRTGQGRDFSRGDAAGDLWQRPARLRVRRCEEPRRHCAAGVVGRGECVRACLLAWRVGWPGSHGGECCMWMVCTMCSCRDRRWATARSHRRSDCGSLRTAPSTFPICLPPWQVPTTVDHALRISQAGYRCAELQGCVLHIACGGDN